VNLLINRVYETHCDIVGAILIVWDFEKLVATINIFAKNAMSLFIAFHLVRPLGGTGVSWK
jgi:hypothetical protein